MTSLMPCVFANLFSMSDGVAISIIAGLLGVGFVLGFLICGMTARIRARGIEKILLQKKADLENEIKSRRDRAEIDARMAVLEAEEKFARYTAERKAELQMKEEARLSELAKMTFSEARKEISQKLEEEMKADAQGMAMRIQEEAKEDAFTVARKIIAEAIQRCAVDQVSELSTARIFLDNKKLKGRIVGKDGRNAKAFELATGTTLILDDEEEIVISSFDPLRREIAKRAMEALIADGRIHADSIEKTVERVKKIIDEESRAEGAKAAAEAGVMGLHSEILKLMGLLKYRSSFSQNALRHSVEVALIEGVMASELGLDEAVARKIGFLHDIGKVIFSSQGGSHAELGADALRHFGESEEVCRAVESHHAETNADGGIYGILCAAADSISASRPGARLENASEYVERVKGIEKIAMGYKGVKNAFAVQSGRDLRVIVDSNIVSDAQASEMAREIAREISKQIKFSGVIKVTLLREMRCIEYAK